MRRHDIAGPIEETFENGVWTVTRHIIHVYSLEPRIPPDGIQQRICFDDPDAYDEYGYDDTCWSD